MSSDFVLSFFIFLSFFLSFFHYFFLSFYSFIFNYCGASWSVGLLPRGGPFLLLWYLPRMHNVMYNVFFLLPFLYLISLCLLPKLFSFLCLLDFHENSVHVLNAPGLISRVSAQSIGNLMIVSILISKQKEDEINFTEKLHIDFQILLLVLFDRLLVSANIMILEIWD